MGGSEDWKRRSETTRRELKRKRGMAEGKGEGCGDNYEGGEVIVVW